MADRSIYRAAALQAYQRGQDKDVVPRIISWPIIVCLWVLLGILLVAGFLAWYVEVPTYVGATGIVEASSQISASTSGQSVVLVFLSPDEAAHLHAGLPADVEIGSTEGDLHGTIAIVEQGVTSPDTARTIYHLNGPDAQVIQQPSVPAVIKLDSSLPATTYAGSIVSVRVQTGWQRFLTLIPGLDRIFGGN